MNSSKIDSLVEQVADRHKKLAKNKKRKQKSAVVGMVNAHPVAIALIFHACFIVTLLTIAGILIAACGHSCCRY